MSTADAKVVLITGASGGLGQVLVSEFLALGWRVAAGWHRQNSLAAHERLLPLQFDVTQSEAVDRAVAEILDRWEHIDVLVNNAGVQSNRFCGELGDDDWDRVLDGNLKGSFLCSRAVVRSMLKRRSGHVINISSFAARAGPRGQAHYAAAKAGLVGLTQSLARESGRRNVQANVIFPGVLPTPMTAGLSAEQLKIFAEANVLGRINESAEVARFVAFLAGTQNISGQVFQLDSRIAPWC
jgi:3-oxoacyl-[acyl-carrier protein] reductase